MNRYASPEQSFVKRVFLMDEFLTTMSNDMGIDRYEGESDYPLILSVIRH